MSVAVFDTQAEAETRQQADLVTYLSMHSNADYISQTTIWSTPLQRNDGKWTICCCEYSDYTGVTVVPFDIADYPEGT